jgi:hypothetical protein
VVIQTLVEVVAWRCDQEMHDVKGIDSKGSGLRGI